MGKIETGIDKLVDLVTEQKKLTIDEASKILGVSNAVVQEWAEFLEEEGLIGLEYSLSKTYLVEKKITKKDLDKKEKDYARKKEVFVRRVDTALKQLEKETTGFEEIKSAYNSLKADIGDEIDQVKEELDELRHYEKLKQSIDQDIIQQKIDYQKLVDDVHRKLHTEEKRYEKVLAEIKGERDRIDKERDALKTLEEKEESLQTRLAALKEVADGVDKEVGTMTKILQHDEERLSRLHRIADEIEKNLRTRKQQEIDPLISESQEHGKKIMAVQDSIIKKVEARNAKITQYEREGGEIIAKFDKFFQKRMETEKLLNHLEKEKAEMAHELEGLKNKALAFDLLGKGNVKEYIHELDKSYKEFEHRKGLFEEGVDKLRHFISGN